MKGSLSDSRYPSGRKRPPSRTIATSSGVNRQFHKKGLAYAPEAPKKNRGLRGLKQLSFPDLLSWSSKRCEKYLTGRGFFGRNWSRRCYACSAKLGRTENSAILRCTNRQCVAERPRIWAEEHFYVDMFFVFIAQTS